MFETDSIPTGWIQRLNYMDEVWVPTNFARDIFEKNGVHSSKLRVVGEAVDTEYFAYSDRNARSSELLSEDLKELVGICKCSYSFFLKISSNFIINSKASNTFVFLFVGKYETRKGLDILLRAYMKAFTTTVDDVLLLFLTSAYHSSDDFDSKLQATIMLDGELQKRDQLPSYRILSGLTQHSLKMLYTLIDVLVHIIIR